jgi:hypothetical protein
VRVLDRQHDYSFGINTEHWDELRPGLLHQRAGLSLNNPVTKLVAATASAPVTTLLSTPTGTASGTPAWSNPGNIAASDANRASVALTADQRSGELWATAWGAAVANAPVGIAFAVQVRCSGGNDVSMPILRAQLRNGAGAAVGTVKTATLTTAENYLAFGGSTDLWGAGLSIADLNDPDFGVILTVQTPTANTPSVVDSSPGTAASVPSGGTVVWASPDNAKTYGDSTPAGASNIPPQDSSHWLELTNWGLAVPAGATIAGIMVTVRNRAEGGSTNDGQGRIVVQLLKNSAVHGNAKAIGTMPNDWNWYVYSGGGSSDLWGGTWTQADIIASGFGVRMKVENIDSDPFGFGNQFVDALNDGVVVTITYAQAGTTWTTEVNHVQLTLFTTAQGRFVYAASGNQLTKLQIATDRGLPVLTQSSTKFFSHGTTMASPPISDVIVLKDGAVPNPAVLIGFDNAAQIQQINAIASSGDDGYQALSANKAFAGQFAMAMGANNTEALVWKSLGVSGEATGAFARVNSAAITNAAKDYTNLQNWTPRSDTGSPYHVGDFDASITGLAEYQRGLVAAKPGGIYLFDQNANAFNAYAMTAFEHPDNGRGLLPWQRTLLIPTVQDLADIDHLPDSVIGLSTLLSNRSPVQGYPTALASYGRYLYWAVYDGAHATILRAKRRTFERVPHPLVIYPEQRIEDMKVQALLVTPDEQGAIWLLYGTRAADGTNYDVGYTVLWPANKRRYAAAGEWHSSEFGSPEKRTIVESLVFYGEGLSGQGYYTPALAWDGGGYAPLGDGSPITGNGRVVKTSTPGVNDRGYLGTLRLLLTNTTATNQPTLRGLTATAGGAGGVIVQGQRQADVVDRFEFVTPLANDQESGRGGRLPGTAASRFQSLLALQGTTATLVHRDYFGDGQARSVYVQAVVMEMGRQEGAREGERRVRIRGRLLQGHGG